MARGMDGRGVRIRRREVEEGGGVGKGSERSTLYICPGATRFLVTQLYVLVASGHTDDGGSRD